jgi:hypothetical protein
LKPSVLEAETNPLQILGILKANVIQKNYIVDYLRKKILNFAIILSEENTNPVKYL